MPDELGRPNSIAEIQHANLQAEFDKAKRETLAFLAPDAEFSAKIAKIRTEGPRLLELEAMIQANNITLIADSPGNKPSAHHIATYYHLRQTEAKKSLSVVNYTYIETAAQKETLRDAVRRGIKIQLMSNASVSAGDWTDAWELSFPYQTSLSKLGVNVFGFNGTNVGSSVGSSPSGTAGSSRIDSSSNGSGQPVSDAKPQQIVLHSKTLVIDGKDSWIGTNNTDPRSENINAEVALVVNDSPELAARMAKTFQNLQQHAFTVSPTGKYSDAYGRSLAPPAQKFKSFGERVTQRLYSWRNRIFVREY